MALKSIQSCTNKTVRTVATMRQRAGQDARVPVAGVQIDRDGHVHWLDNGASRVVIAAERVAR